MCALSRAENCIQVSFDNWEAHAHLDPVVPGDDPAQIFYGPEWESPQKSTRREKQLVRRLAAERKSTPGSIRTELQVQMPGANMAKHAVALKATVRRARKGLHLRQAPYEAMHSAAETPSSSPGALNVLAYYPVVNAMWPGSLAPMLSSAAAGWGGRPPTSPKSSERSRVHSRTMLYGDGESLY